MAAVRLNILRTSSEKHYGIWCRHGLNHWWPLTSKQKQKKWVHSFVSYMPVPQNCQSRLIY